MKRILFVDDEPRILRGLGRMLMDKRDRWAMDFAQSVPEAFDLLERHRFDIIVSDVRMPGMSGAELLDKVSREHPHMVRIVLSGDSDPELIMKSVKPAHQFLCKPCEPCRLEEVLDRADQLGDLLRNQALGALVSRMGALPSLPGTYQELMNELERPDSSLERVGAIVARDMGLSATALKLVNSAFFGLRQTVESPMSAVRMLGLDVVKGLAISVRLFAVLDLSQAPGVSFENLWSHCLNVAGLAKRIAQMEGLDRRALDESFNAGLLHDVGKLVLASAAPEEYNQVIDRVRSENRVVFEVESEVLGASHAELGAYLMNLWGLSQPIVEAIAYHHRPQQSPCQTLTPLTTVHVANFIEHQAWVVNRRYARRSIDKDYLITMGVGGKFKEWLKLGEELIRDGAGHG